MACRGRGADQRRDTGERTTYDIGARSGALPDVTPTPLALAAAVGLSGDVTSVASRQDPAAVDAARGAGPAPVTGAECLPTLKAIFGLYKAAETGVTQQIS